MLSHNAPLEPCAEGGRIMMRNSSKLFVGLAIWFLGQPLGWAQESTYIRGTAISDQVSDSGSDATDEAATEPQFDSEVEQAAWLQQQPALSSPSSAAQPQRRSTRGSRQANIGLASVPNMFGDLAGATSTLVMQKPSPFGGPSRSVGTFSLPIAGGGSRIGKISENDSPIPRDRVFFSYNHFQNVFQISETPLTPPGPTQIRQEPIDRYTL